MVILGATRRQRTQFLRSKTSSINVFRSLWVLVVLWCELGVFWWNVSWCRWPDQELTRGRAGIRPYHILLITDPQVPRPYKGWLPSSTWLKQYVVNLNLRKSWNAVKKLQPESVIFLGDMLRYGSNIRDMNSYGEYYAQFSSIFALDPAIPKYYVPGNRDVGLGSSRMFSVRARDRFEAHFGPINQAVETGNHTFVLLDAPGLVEEDYRRHGAQVRFADWLGVSGGSIDFIKSVAANPSKRPVILISHIPLFRPDTASCGPLREHGNIRRGVGRGYQNLLGRDTTNFVLESMQPSAIFSGDDHDYCEHLHMVHTPTSREIREVTVRSFSMATRLKRPGLQLLSLLSSPDFPSEITYADAPCLLPNQSRIYTHWYAPLILITMMFLLVSNLRRSRLPRLQGNHAWRDSIALHRDRALPDSSDGASPPNSPIHFKSSHSQPMGLRSASTLTPNIFPSQPPTPLGGTPLLSSAFFRTPTDDDDGQDQLWPGRVSPPERSHSSSSCDCCGMDSAYFLPSPGTRKIGLLKNSTWLPTFSTRSQVKGRPWCKSGLFMPFLNIIRIGLFTGRRRARTRFGIFVQDAVRIAWPPSLIYLGISLWSFHWN